MKKIVIIEDHIGQAEQLKQILSHASEREINQDISVEIIVTDETNRRHEGDVYFVGSAFAQNGNAPHDAERYRNTSDLILEYCQSLAEDPAIEQLEILIDLCLTDWESFHVNEALAEHEPATGFRLARELRDDLQAYAHKTVITTMSVYILFTNGLIQHQWFEDAEKWRDTASFQPHKHNTLYFVRKPLLRLTGNATKIDDNAVFAGTGINSELYYTLKEHDFYGKSTLKELFLSKKIIDQFKAVVFGRLLLLEHN